MIKHYLVSNYPRSHTRRSTKRGRSRGIRQVNCILNMAYMSVREKRWKGESSPLHHRNVGPQSRGLEMDIFIGPHSLSLYGSLWRWERGAKVGPLAILWFCLTNYSEYFCQELSQWPLINFALDFVRKSAFILKLGRWRTFIYPTESPVKLAAACGGSGVTLYRLYSALRSTV